MLHYLRSQGAVPEITAGPGKNGTCRALPLAESRKWGVDRGAHAALYHPASSIDLGRHGARLGCPACLHIQPALGHAKTSAGAVDSPASIEGVEAFRRLGELLIGVAYHFRMRFAEGRFGGNTLDPTLVRKFFVI